MGTQQQQGEGANYLTETRVTWSNKNGRVVVPEVASVFWTLTWVEEHFRWPALCLCFPASGSHLMNQPKGVDWRVRPWAKARIFAGPERHG
jgi:hypothetical protein